MLPAKFRLKNKKEFSEVFRKGKSFASRNLVMKHESAGSDAVKVGFSVGLKFSKKAVKRNKVKRWLREAARTNLLGIKPGSKIIFILNPKVDFSTLNLALLRKEMKDLLQKSKLL